LVLSNIVEGRLPWKIGDGSLIPIWNTPWLRNDTNPYVVTHTTASNLPSNVSSLIDANLGCWNCTYVRENLCDRDANEILHIPLVNLGKSDEVIWRYDKKKGLYLVKSAYRVCVDVMIHRDVWKVEGNWNKLWALAIPPKVKHFMWRLGRDCLPNIQRLMTKGVNCESNCAVCHRFTEYNWHLFLDCADSIAVWKNINMWTTLESLMVDVEGFQDVFVRMWQHLNTFQLITFAMTAWSLWRKRNLKLWEDKTGTMEHVIGRAQGTLHAWKHARHTHTNDRTQQHHVQPVYWQPPPPNYFKCNIDATFFTSEKR